MIHVEVGASAYGSSSVNFRRATLADIARVDADYLVEGTHQSDEAIAKLNDNSWDSGREYWGYHRQAESHEFRGSAEERLRFKQSMALMTSRLFAGLAFPHVAYSTSQRRLLEGYGNGPISRLPATRWDKFTFDVEGRWEADGDHRVVVEFLDKLTSDLWHYTGDDLRRAGREYQDPEVQADYRLGRQAAGALGRGARRWAKEAIWAARYARGRKAPAYPELLSLPQGYSAWEGLGAPEIDRRLRGCSEEAARRTDLPGLAWNALVLLRRQLHWSLAPEEELEKALLEVHHWVYRQAPPEEAESLRHGLKRLTNDSLILAFTDLMDRSLEFSRAVELAAELSHEAGRREFARVTAGLDGIEESAEETGELWREATLYELLACVLGQLRRDV